jgi:hypothetical protein
MLSEGEKKEKEEEKGRKRREEREEKKRESHAFRNRLKCPLLQSIILSLSLITVNVIDYHFLHLLK